MSVHSLIQQERHSLPYHFLLHRSPGTSPVKQRMVYSASSVTLKSRLGVALEIQGNDEGDLEYDIGNCYQCF